MKQNSQAFLTQMVQFWWENLVKLSLNSCELASLVMTLIFLTNDMHDKCVILTFSPSYSSKLGLR